VLARAAASALLMLVAGGLLGWLVVGTPIISSLMPSGRPTPLQIAVGIFAWGFAIVVPAGFLLLGTVRMFGVVERATARPRTMGTRLAKQLGADHVAVTNLVVPGGRRVHELLLGPYGVVVLAEVPPPTVSRHVGSRWEVRGARGRWIAIEAPVDRAMRDAEQVRSWLAAEDEYDFVVRVYAASSEFPAVPWFPRTPWPGGSRPCRRSAG
jgi:hypothetical protein